MTSSFPQRMQDAEQAMLQRYQVAHGPGFITHAFTCSPPRKPLTPSRYPKAFQERIRQLPPAMRAFFTQVQEVKMEWYYHDPAFSPLRIVGRTGILQVMGQFSDTTLFPEGNCPIWDERLPPERLARFAGYCQFDTAAYNGTYVLWRTKGNAEVELALYLGQDRLHPLPFTPLAYLDVGLDLRFIELWQLLFIPEDQQGDYAEAIGTVVSQIRHLFPEAAHWIPTHVATRFPVPVSEPALDYRQLLQATVDHLRTISDLVLTTCQISPTGTTLGTLERVRREIGMPLPADLRAFYSQLDGCCLTWHTDQNRQPPQCQGRVWLWPLEYVFGGHNNFSKKHWDGHIHEGDLWPATHADDEPKLRMLRPFEFMSAERYPCFQLPLPTRGPTPVVMLAGELDDIRPLTLTLTEYLLRLLAGAGLEGWQEVYYADEQDALPAVDQSLRWQELQALGIDPSAVLLPPIPVPDALRQGK